MSIVVIPLFLAASLLAMGIVWLTPGLRGNLLLWTGRERRARKLFEAELEQHPEKITLYKKLAKIYYLQNRRDKRALRVFDIILNLKIPFEWREEIQTEVAKYYIIQGRKDTTAIKLIEKAVDLEIEKLRRN
ncbi:MAG: tetratricopeptide repeat protein [bacterium]